MTRFVFFAAGIFSVIAQTVMVRELFVVFQGTELAIGVVLFVWLLGSAAGSYLASHGPAEADAGETRGLAVSFVAFCYFLPAAFVLARAFRQVFHLFPGEGISLKTMIAGSLLILFPLAASAGAQFGFGMRWARHRGSSSGYLWESLGYLAGGVIFTYILLSFFNTSMVLCLLLGAGTSLCGLLLPRYRKVLLGAAAAVVLISVPASRQLERMTATLLYPGWRVEEVRNSPYAQIAVAEKNGERSFLADGVPFVTLPSPDLETAEDFGLFPLLFHRDPRRVLLIGGSGLFAAPLLAHGVSTLDCIEPDPVPVELLRKYGVLPADDPRLTVRVEDGRRFLGRTDRMYDVILVALPAPFTVSLNRYYTVEFFTEAKRRLSRGGILALRLPGSLVYVDRAMADLNRTVRDSLAEVFSSVRVVPGDLNLLLASDGALPGRSIVASRLSRRAARAVFLSPEYLRYRMDFQRTRWLEGELARPGAVKRLNRDFSPRALMASLIYWQSVFAPRSTTVYTLLARNLWLPVLVILLWILLNGSGLAATAFTSGAAGMGLQMLSIWALQVHSGNIYHWIGALSAVFMGGSALGAWLFGAASGENKAPAVFRHFAPPSLLAVESIFCVWIVAWWLLIDAGTLPWWIFFVFSAVSGLLVGFEFPLLTRAVERLHGTPQGAAAGRTYAVDLLGGASAALLGGTLFIPAGGFEASILLILVMKVVNYVRWVR